MTPDVSPDDDGSGESDWGSRLEQVIIVLSVVLLVTTLGFIAWQAAMTSEVADPVATIETVETREDGESLRVGVQLDNRRGAGLQSVTVGVECGATEQTLEFTHVPAGGYRRASVICPAGTTPETAVETWMEA